MSSKVVWRVALVAVVLGVLAGVVTVAVHGQPSISVASTSATVA